ncbi:hypothetical protein D3Z36_03565 [Lachnospiraceae bacterium]|nr:hypothetical protein [Lachnospiraceae bacterium]
MGSEVIKIGDKVDVQILQNIEKDKSGKRSKRDKSQKVYHSRVQDILENGMFEIEVPTMGGRMIFLPTGVRLEFLFYTKSGMYRCLGHIKERYNKECLNLLLIERKTPWEKFQRRDYYRHECLMEILYYPILKEELEQVSIEELKTHHRMLYPQETPQNGIAVDISGGGARIVTDRPGERGEYLVISMSLNEDDYMEVLGEVLFCQGLENKYGDRANNQSKYEYRIQFSIDSKERERIIKYIFEQERKYRQKG